MSDKVLDLVIIGAGPIGLNCGIEATKAGLDYLIWKLKAKFYEEVLDVAKQADIYILKTNKQTYHTRSIILSTGFYDLPRLLNIKGEKLPKVKHYYDEPHPYIAQKVLVIGAANSACDVALELYYKGAEVTMAVRKEALSHRVKYWIKPNIENRIKEGSIKAYFNTTIEEITPTSVILNTPDGKVELANDWVLAMTGYQPNYELFKKIGIESANDEFLTPIHHEETLETNMPNVYIAGVINGGLKTSKYFIENTRIHSGMIISDLVKKIAQPVAEGSIQ